MKFQIKSAELEDSSSIAALFDEYRVFYNQESNLTLAEDFISSRLKNSESTIFCAISNSNEYVGFVQLYPTFSSVSVRRSWVLNDLYVSSDVRGRGVAKLLMSAARDLALSTGANGIALETSFDNKNAQALYESLGYKHESKYKHYFLNLEQ